MSTLKEMKELRKVARESLESLKAIHVTFLCDMFFLPKGDTKEDKISRLLRIDEIYLIKLVQTARMIELCSHTVDDISKKDLKDILKESNLPITGNRTDLFLRLLENGKIDAKMVLAFLNIQKIRNLYEELFGGPSIRHEWELKNRILDWACYETPQEMLSPGTHTMVGHEYSQQSSLKTSQPIKAYEYNIAISFASEDKPIADNLAEQLKQAGVKVFYYPFLQADLWGKSLSESFQNAFGERTEYVLVLVSKDYPAKDWTDFEFTIARKESGRRKEEFILPVRLDDSIIAGLRSDVCFMDYRKDGVEAIVQNIIHKLSLSNPMRSGSDVDDRSQEASATGRRKAYRILAYGDDTHWMPWEALPRNEYSNHFWVWWEKLPGLLDDLEADDRSELIYILQATSHGVRNEQRDEFRQRYNQLRLRAQKKISDES